MKPLKKYKIYQNMDTHNLHANVWMKSIFQESFTKESKEKYIDYWSK